MPHTISPTFLLQGCSYRLVVDKTESQAIQAAKVTLFQSIATKLGTHLLKVQLNTPKIRICLSADVPDGEKQTSVPGFAGLPIPQTHNIPGWHVVGYFDETSRTVTLNIRHDADKLAQALEQMSQNIAWICRFGTSPAKSPLTITKRDLVPTPQFS